MQLYAVRAEMTPEAFTKAGPEPEDTLAKRIEALSEEVGIHLEVVLLGRTDSPHLRSSAVGAVIADAGGW